MSNQSIRSSNLSFWVKVCPFRGLRMGFYLNVGKMDHKSKGHVFIDSHVCYNAIKNMKPFKLTLLHQFIYTIYGFIHFKDSPDETDIHPSGRTICNLQFMLCACL